MSVKSSMGTHSDATKDSTASTIAVLQSHIAPEALLEAAPYGVLILGPDGRIVLANSRIEELFHHSRIDLLGRKVETILPGLSALDQEAASAAEGRRPLARAMEGRAKDGSALAVEVILSPIRSGQDVFLAAIVHDASVKRATEARLVEVERRMREAEHVANLGSWEGDPRTNLFRASPEFFAIYGSPVEAGAVPGGRFFSLLPSEDQSRVQRIVEAAIRAGRPWEVIHNVQRPDGTRRIVQSRGQPILDQQQKVVRVVGTSRDITAETEEKEALREERDLYESILQAASDLGQGIVIIDGGRIVHANDHVVEIVGYPREELLGLTDLLAPIAPESRAQLEANLRQVDPKATEFSGRGHTTIVRKDGRKVEVEYAAKLRRTGDKVRIFVTLSNVSERIRLSEAQLERAQGERELERLKEVDTFRTRFINAAAHELRTPLTPIKLQLHIIKTDHAPFLGPQIRRSIEILDRNVERLHQLVQDVLDGSRLQSGRFGVSRKPIDLAPVIAEAVESFEAPARQAGVGLNAKVHRPLPAEADETRISQVLFNLLSNAIKFTSAGGHIEVDARKLGSDVVVRVSDTGLGLSAEQIQRLFVPFSRVHDTMESTVPGTGLGLYISKGIVDLHDGRITVESGGAHQGATFTVHVPLTHKPLIATPRATRVGVGADTRRDALARRVRELI